MMLRPGGENCLLEASLIICFSGLIKNWLILIVWSTGIFLWHISNFAETSQSRVTEFCVRDSSHATHWC